ncbi:hypothetical protein VNI00_011900 [Paramarasmius palmivorus]|uniref:Uncharacterized protein n=1 Tax=Paramarasmius palmivorus TaxID=297713 RepID=A0AAW0C8X7_9AGAR
MVGSFRLSNSSLYFCFRYSSLHWMKGQVLRGAISYITFLQNAKKDKVRGARRFYIGAGIKNVSVNQTDKEAVKQATLVLASALRTANKWVRSPSNDTRIGALTGEGGLLARVGNLTGSGSMGPLTLDDILDLNYRSQEIMDLLSCPIELDRAGLRGLYEFMRISDNDQTIYADQAQMMAQVLDKALPFMKKDGSDDLTEMVTELNNLLKKCTGNRVIKI